MNITDRGQLFSIDTAISFVVICLMVYLMISLCGNIAGNSLAREKETEVMRIAISASEILVKNSNAGDTMLGAAEYNSALKRVESNIIDYPLLLNAKSNQINSLYLKFKSGEEVKIFENGACGEKIFLERFVAVRRNGLEKAKLVLGVCYES